MREKTMAQIRRYVEICRSLKDPEMRNQLLVGMCELSESFAMRVFVSEALFPRAFRLYATKKQHDTWIDDITSWRIIGCFAMTELGHSSSLQGLETTATFDIDHNEFIIHSPSEMATKWWIGMAGQTATHTVSLRCQRTGQLQPGVTCGDIGHKAGRNGLDNGWIQFSHVRIPREYMLMRWATIEQDGTFINKVDNPAISYAGLIPERLEITKGIPTCVGQALTIATRYACIRHQGGNNQQIMDYTTIYTMLCPAIATIYAIHATDKRVWQQWYTLERNAVDHPQAFMERLPDMHALSAGIKTTVTWYGAEVLENCRRVMGGHSFSRYNAIADAIGDYSVMTTGGGDNFVLAQQTSRYLLVCLRRAVNGIRFSSDTSVFYLNRLNEPFIRADNCTMCIATDWDDIEKLHNLLIWLCIRKLQSLGDKLAQTMSSTTSNKAWNTHLSEVVCLATIHTYTYISQTYVNMVADDCQNENDSNKKNATTLVLIHTRLCRLYILHIIQRHLVDYMRVSPGFFSQDQLTALDTAIARATIDIRHQAVPLVDAWGYPDFILKAPLGRYNGDGYTAYVDVVRRAPRNVFNALPEYFEREIKPLTWPDVNTELQSNELESVKMTTKKSCQRSHL